MRDSSARQGVKEQKKNFWLDKFVFYIKERNYQEARKIMYNYREYWENDLVRRAEICSNIYDIMNELLYSRNFSEAKTFAFSFPELGIENWLPENLMDKPYKLKKRN